MVIRQDCSFVSGQPSGRTHFVWRSCHVLYFESREKKMLTMVNIIEIFIFLSRIEVLKLVQHVDINLTYKLQKNMSKLTFKLGTFSRRRFLLVTSSEELVPVDASDELVPPPTSRHWCLCRHQCTHAAPAPPGHCLLLCRRRLLGCLGVGTWQGQQVNANGHSCGRTAFQI
jgi:hypothetical protein